MKKIALMLTAAFMMSAVAPVYAQMSPEQKDQCLLASKDCVNEVNSINQKIKKLQKEIKKGKKVYSEEEIKKLNAKLKEAEEMVDTMLKGGQ
jgi:peptidoglycan hydrolase CwlO-like protein